MSDYIIGLDFGSASARGVLIDASSGQEIASHIHNYRHDILTSTLPDGTRLPQRWALQVAVDYIEAAEDILSTIGAGRRVCGLGIGFTASSPMPTTHDGTPLSSIFPADRHAYVKLWKHGAAQPQADRINQTGGDFLDRFGGKLSGEWLLAKAAQIAEEAPESWARTERFIEAGDWLVWQLTGREARSLGFAAYKAQYDEEAGYPEDIVPELVSRLNKPLPIGSEAGRLTEEWQVKTGIIGPCSVAVAVIDSHVVLPAIDAVEDGCFVGALGTSAVSMMLTREFRPLPKGIEGVAFDGTIRGLWCYEAGQASFGDTLSWFVQQFPHGDNIEASFEFYNNAATELLPGDSQIIALDWWGGNRVPHSNSSLSGMLLGLTNKATSVDIYKALIESLCFGMRQILNSYERGGFTISRVIMTSGLAQRNPLLLQTMANVLGRNVEVPNISNPTALGAAIHGAVAAGLVDDFSEGATRFGAKNSKTYHSEKRAFSVYSTLFRQYDNLSNNSGIAAAMEVISDLKLIGSAHD